MRRTLLSLVLATTLVSCGGSSQSSNLDGVPLQGNVLQTTVRVERRFLYALSREDGSVSGFVLETEAAGGHSHGHTHGKILAQHDHDHEHEHGDGDEAHAGLGATPLDSSPYTFPITPQDMVVGGAGETMFLLDRAGNLLAVRIDGFTGLLTPGQTTVTGVANPRLLRLSADGQAVAVLGDSLAVFALGGGGALAPAAGLDGTADWTDVRLNGQVGVGARPSGAIGFAWSPGARISAQPEVALPGGTRGGAAYAEAGVFLVNTADRSLSQLSQDGQGVLTPVASFTLPDSLTDPQTVCAIFGDDLLVGDSDSVALFHLHDGELEEEGHTEVDQTPSLLFPVPETNFVLAGHAQGEGYHVLEVGEDGLSVHEEAETERADVSAFGYAERTVQVTETVNL